jgi:hypothetical protein
MTRLFGTNVILTRPKLLRLLDRPAGINLWLAIAA